MNMIDMYLAMNSCERSGDDVYFVDPMDNTKREHIAVIKKTEIKDGVLNIHMNYLKSIDFITFNIVVENADVQE